MSTTAVQKLYDVCKATFSASSGVPSAAALERVRLALGMSYMYRVVWTSSPPHPICFPCSCCFQRCLFVCIVESVTVLGFSFCVASLYWGFWP
jgi:hypothetical protein